MTGTNSFLILETALVSVDVYLDSLRYVLMCIWRKLATRPGNDWNHHSFLILETALVSVDVSSIDTLYSLTFLSLTFFKIIECIFIDKNFPLKIFC